MSKKSFIPRSLCDIKDFVKKDHYEGLPKELRRFNWYVPDSGHCILVIPEQFLESVDKTTDLDCYEVLVPCRYVLEKGYRLYRGHVICNVPYDSRFGVCVDEKYSEYDLSENASISRTLYLKTCEEHPIQTTPTGAKSVVDIVNNIDPTFIEDYALAKKEEDGWVTNIFTYDGMLDYLYGLRAVGIEPERANKLIRAIEKHCTVHQ